jgi:hypothetical protein
MEKKPAYYAMKRAGKRRAVSVTYKRDGYYLNVINDTDRRLTAQVVFWHRTLGGEIIAKHTYKANVAPFAQTAFKLEFDKNVKQSFLYAELNENGVPVDDTVYFFDLWKDKRFKTDLRVEKNVAEDGLSATVKLTADSFARTVFIDLPQGLAANLSDNYFDLIKGGAKVVSVSADKPFKAEDIIIKTFADDWEE